MNIWARDCNISDTCGTFRFLLLGLNYYVSDKVLLHRMTLKLIPSGSVENCAKFLSRDGGTEFVVKCFSLIFSSYLGPRFEVYALKFALQKGEIHSKRLNAVKEANTFTHEQK